jgi:hypothetical protein
MDADSFGEAKNVMLVKERSLSRYEGVHLRFGYAKICGGFIGNTFIVRNIFANTGFVALQFGIKDGGGFAVPPKNMLDFMPQYEPEIVYAVEAHSHSNYRRSVVQPEADTIDLCGRQGFNDDESDSRL